MGTNPPWRNTTPISVSNAQDCPALRDMNQEWDDDEARAAESALDSIAQVQRPIPKPDGSTWPEPIDLGALAGRDPLPPAFIVQDWLPCGYATLLAGHGGVGKSGIALHLAACIATGTPWWGLPCEMRSVLYLSCEDRENVIHWRIKRVAANLDVPMSAMYKLSIIDLVGYSTILWEPNNYGNGGYAMAFAELQAWMTGHEVVIVDGISDTYGGDENKRAQVKAFVNALVSLIDPLRGAVLLVGHVSKPTLNGVSAEGYSGNTAWHNSVRARWYIYPEKPKEEGDRSDNKSLILELQKSNLGRGDQEIRFNWDEDSSMFVGSPAEPQMLLDRNIRDDVEREGVLQALRASMTSGVRVPAAASGNRTAYHVLSARPEFPDSLRHGTVAARRFRNIIERLMQCGEVRMENVKTGDRKVRECLVCANAPMLRQ